MIGLVPIDEFVGQSIMENDSVQLQIGDTFSPRLDQIEVVFFNLAGTLWIWALAKVGAQDRELDGAIVQWGAVERIWYPSLIT